MRLHSITAVLAAASLLAIPPALGGIDDSGLGMGTFPSSCTPEARVCLEKLATRYPSDRAHYSLGTQQALLDLLDADPHCAMVLWGTVLP